MKICRVLLILLLLLIFSFNVFSENIIDLDKLELDKIKADQLNNLKLEEEQFNIEIQKMIKENEFKIEEKEFDNDKEVKDIIDEDSKIQIDDYYPSPDQKFYDLKEIVIKWLEDHPEIATAMKWCNEPRFYMPDEEDKMSWHEWSETMKDEFLTKFVEIWQWGNNKEAHLMTQSFLVALEGIDVGNVLDSDFPDHTTNLAMNIDNDNFLSYIAFSPEDTWNIYINYVALSLVAEIQNWYDWSILDYDTLSLNLLYDVTYWFRKGNTSGNYTNYRGEISNDHGDMKRENNLAQATPGPPRWTYWYLEHKGIVGNTRLETIVNFIDWLRGLKHYYGQNNFGNCEDFWQYRGSPPVTDVIRGTTYSGDPPDRRPPTCFIGGKHWTAGCHGTAGFIQVVLRILNIPVEIIRYCGHSQVRFITEELYLDHGDTPYFNSNECEGFYRVPSHVDAFEFLIDRATYDEWFGYIPETDNSFEITYYPNLGRRARELIEIYGGEPNF